MSAHISEELPGLLSGEASRDVVLEAAEHLRTCPDCQQELVSAVVAHASLMSAHRFAPEVVMRGDAAEDGGPQGPLPDLSAVFTAAHAEAARRRRFPRRRVIAAAVAAAVIVGGGVTAGVLASSGSNGQQQTRTVALAPVGHSRAGATATLIGTDRMRINATALPALDEHHHYEVWLTSSNGAVQQSVGFIGADRMADIAVPTSLMLSYRDIAVSVQGLHQTSFSGKTVLLGRYA